jgi:CHAT domain-containing protein
MRFFFVFFFVSLCFALACRQEPGPDAETDNQTSFAADTTLLLNQADALFHKAEEYYGGLKNDSALQLHLQSLKIREELTGNPVKLAESYLKVARYYLKDFKYQVADKYLEKAVQIAQEEAIPVSLRVDIFDAYALTKLEMKDFPTASSFTLLMLQLIDKNDRDNSAQHVNAYRRLGNIQYYLKHYDEAIGHLNKAIDYVSPDNDRALANLYSSIAICLHQQGKYKEALHVKRKAIYHDLNWAGAGSDPIAIRYLQMAFMHRDLDQLDSALLLLNKNLEIRRSVHGEKNVNTFGARYSLGEFYSNLKDYDSAIHYYHESLISLVRTFNEKDWMFNPRPSPDEMNTDLIIGLVGKASSLNHIFRKDTTRLDLLQLSLNTYFLADSVFTVFNRNFIHDDPQMRQFESGSIPYPEMVEIAFELFSSTQDPKYLDNALAIMERSRGVLLQQALNRAEAYSSAGLSDMYRKEENKLISARQDILQHLSKSDSKARTDSLYEKLLEVNTRHQKLLMQIEKTNPVYFTVKYKDAPVRVRDVADLLNDRNATLLEYMWDEQAIYILAINADGVKAKKVALTPEISRAFEEITTQLRSPPENASEKEQFIKFCVNAESLFRHLVRDFLPKPKGDTKKNSPLIISADGPLASFPFEVLITRPPTGNEVDYRLPYIVLEYPVSYTFSARLLLKHATANRTGNKLLALGYAGNGPSRQQRNGFSNLPGTEKEINAIKEVMKNTTNKYYLESEASESVFKQQINDFNIVHLALHGIGDTLNALESRLIFRSEADSVEDGNLYAHELYNLNLENLNLAILSACESGIGKHQTGEGVMSIARGFAYAGCPSQIISLWKIDDRTTAQVMSSFYRNLSEGKAIDIALAQAKADYLAGANEFNTHPSYWAAFLQVGDSRSLNVNHVNWKIWLVTVLLFLLTGIYLYRLMSRW